MNRNALPLAFALTLSLALGMAPISFALVPGPILVNPEIIQRSQTDETRQLKVPDTRAKAACLKIETISFCPGISSESFQKKWTDLPESAQQHLISFSEQARLQGLVVLLPQAFHLPAPNLKTGPIPLGPDPQRLETITTHYTEMPVRQDPAEILHFAQDWDLSDLSIWFYSQQHFGLITHTSEQGEYVIGAFVSK